MDIAKEREAFEAALKNVPPLLQPRFKSQFDELASRHASLPAGDAGLAPIEQRIEQLQRDILSAAMIDVSWARSTRAGLAATVLGIFILYVLYFWGLPEDKYATIEGTRPILVFTLIISMLGFGGVLILRALYGAQLPGDELQTRFRMAREIFLVFSGIFGTIIGFYFGAAEGGAEGGAPTVELAYADGRVTATIAGGNSPFTAIYTAAGETGGRVMDDNDRVHSIAVGNTCPDDAQVRVIDAQNHRTEATLDCGSGDNGAANDTMPEKNGLNVQ